ncbi:MAG: hypothetical protein KZQ77_02630, partial [Candidatus Thiodiazotropha sp. (ex Notomyrtea botanica)]|nr:hypothetical protein [Candidatus Thiodiazotropha sp. (ex Notomyrtea botanica)]
GSVSDESPVDESDSIAAAPVAAQAVASKEQPEISSEAGSFSGSDIKSGNESKAVAKSPRVKDEAVITKAKPSRQKDLTAAPASNQSTPPSAPKPKKRPSTLKKQAAKKKTVASVARTKARSNGNGSEDAVKPPAKSKPASNVAAFPVRKKAARRGIRLK